MTSPRRAVRRRAPRAWTIWVAGSVIASLALVLLVGCGGGSDASAGNPGSGRGTTTGQTGAGSTASSQTAFADCMRAQGIDIPSGASGGSAPGQLPAGVDQAALQQGLQACGQYLQGGGAPPGAAGAPGVPGGGQALMQCLRKAGVTLPAPQSGQSPGSGMPSPGSPDPKIRAAIAECQAAS